MDRMTTILQGLIKRTEERDLNWKTSVDSKAFIAAVDTTGIIVRMLDDFLETHRLEILNDDGVTAAVLETSDPIRKVPKESRATDEQAAELSRLFTLARQSALNADLTLEKLANDLAKNR